MNSQLDLIIRAQEFACRAHRGQVRKYTGEPYVMHCQEVALIVSQASVRYDNADICAALLHDTVEDTAVTFEDIYQAFGGEIMTLVSDVTDKSKPADGNREVRKTIDRHHLSKASRDAQTIKLADLISNTKSIVAHDPGFAKVYLAEKELLLKVLVLGDADLHVIATKLVTAGKASLGIA